MTDRYCLRAFNPIKKKKTQWNTWNSKEAWDQRGKEAQPVKTQRRQTSLPSDSGAAFSKTAERRSKTPGPLFNSQVIRTRVTSQQHNSKNSRKPSPGDLKLELSRAIGKADRSRPKGQTCLPLTCIIGIERSRANREGTKQTCTNVGATKMRI